MRIPPKTELVFPIFVFSVCIFVLYTIPLEALIKGVITCICIIAYTWITAHIIQYVMRKINERRNKND